MNALEYCQRNIVFRKPNQPITGAFKIEDYRMMEKPLLSLTDPDIRRTVVYKASSCMGTVFLQCTLAYDIARTLGDIQVVAQTDKDAAEWTKTRAKDFILQLPDVERLIKSKEKEKYAITNDLWLFVNKFVKISGPGESNQQSKQVVKLRTDESHMANHYPKGTLASFSKRLGGKWNGHELHVTTAADKGAEVDEYYYEADQNEFHHRCQNCNELVWLLWEQWSKDHYNGERVFQWKENQSDTATLESLRMICPHCQAEFRDLKRTRYAMQTHGDYLAQNPNAPVSLKSFRWSCFASYWISWTEILSEHLKAMRCEGMGDLSVTEDFEKKRLCMSYIPTLHNLGNMSSSRDYKLGGVDLASETKGVWVMGEETRPFGSIDVQDAPLHFWVAVLRYNRKGESRREAYEKLESWGAVQRFYENFHVAPRDVGIDVGHRYAEVLGKCSAWGCYGLQATGEESNLDPVFLHNVNGVMVPNRFYGQEEIQDALIGKDVPKEWLRRRAHPQKVGSKIVAPPGFALVVQWSKKVVGFVLLFLKSGKSGRYFGIASDISDDYIKQLHTYMEAIDQNAKRGTSKRFLKQLSDNDHAFSVESQAIVMAARAGFFPMDFAAQKEEESAA